MVSAALVATMLTVPGGAQARPAGSGEPQRVIVELASPPALTAAADASGAATPDLQRARRGAGDVADQQRRLADRAGVRAVRQFTAAFNGMVVDATPAQLRQLRATPGVRAVHPDTTYTATLDGSVPLIGAPQVWQGTDPHDRDLTGHGTTVAVLDTGIDYTHPDLGGGFGPGHKVVAGYDYVHDDPDPRDDHGHGTHVAGIVAADGAVRGVAPEASLTAYKVLDQFGNGQLSDLLAALDAAVHPDNPHRADVVNLSLSGPGDGADPLSLAASAAAAAGTVVVAAAGNDGPAAHTVTSPAAGDGVLAVGASASGVWVPRARLVEPEARDVPTARRAFSADAPAEPLTVEVVDVGQGLPGSYDEQDVTGRAVLIEETNPHDDAEGLAKARHAQDRGAAVALLYAADPVGVLPQAVADHPAMAQAAVDRFVAGFDEGRLASLVAMDIPGATASGMQAMLAQGGVQVEIVAEDATDQLAGFSARGPSGGFRAKPELVAPGVEILSTMPGGEHARANGTSMAAPHVAGAAALLRQLRPDWPAPQVAAALANSAQPVDGAQPLGHGAGRLDVAAATRVATVATPASLSLGLADMPGASGEAISATATLTLDNRGGDPAELAISVRQHGTPDAAVSVDQDTVSLAPGESAQVDLRVELATVPAAATDVTGWLVAEPAGGDALTVPYLLAIRPLQVSASPDPVTTGAATAVFVHSATDLTSAPTAMLECPGAEPRPVTLDAAGTRFWRGDVTVHRAGVCHVQVNAVADGPTAPRLAGRAAFVVADPAADRHGAVTWQQVGPYGEAGWLAFTADRHRMGVVSRRWPGLFVTEDRMQTWRELRTMPVGDGVPVSVAVHPRADDTMYVAVNGGPAVDPSYQGRLLKTTDFGRSWTILPGPDATIDQVVLDGTGGRLAVRGPGGVVRVSSDDGQTWAELGSWSGVHDLHWIGADLHLATTSGLLRISGAAGPAPAEPEVLFNPGVLGWAWSVGGDSETLAVAGWPGAQLYLSGDGGATFEEVLNPGGVSFERLLVDGDEIVALQGDGTVWVSGDRGQEWQEWPAAVSAVGIDVGRWPQPHPTVADHLYVSSSAAGIYGADAPDAHTRVGIPAAEVFSLALAGDSDGEVLVAGTFRDSFRTGLSRREAIRPGDLEWESAGGEGQEFVVTPFVASSPADPSVVYKVRTGGMSFGVYRSQDGGATWDLRAEPTMEPTSLMVHPADPDRVYIGYFSPTGAGLVVSEDGGDSWQKVHHGRAFEALAGDPGDPDRMWAGDRDGLYLSQDAGHSFTRLSGEQVTALAVDPDDPRRLVAGGRQLFASDDGGATLHPASHGDLDMWVSDLLFGSDGRVYAATTSFFDDLGRIKSGRGVLASGDGGASWAPFGPGLDNPNVTSVAMSGDGRYLFAGTLGGSVHRLRVAGHPSSPGPAIAPPGPPR